jgi:carbamoyl-phosphate synthase small subunit
LEFYWDLTDESYFDDGRREYIVVAYDFGLTYSSLRNLKRLGCDIRVVPADYSPEQVIALKPEGILLAGGPGKPKQMDYAISNISRLIGLRPILATGLGHVLLALSVGAKIEILKSPHFGNEFVIDNSGITGIKRRHRQINTTQSHSISIDRKSLEKEGFKVTLTNRQDHSVEGYISEEYLIHSYAFSLGGQDEFTSACLKNFIDCMAAHRAGVKSR